MVALRITGDNGSVELQTLEVTAAYNYVGPTASAGNDVTVNQGVQTSFSGSYADPDGTVNSSDIAWDFAYDGTTFIANATGSLNATWTPLASGTFLVALRVTDNHGLTSIDTLQVVVNNVAPTVAAMNGVTVTVGDTTPLSATVSDPGGADDPLLVEWDLDYDGTTFTPIQTAGDSLSHTFTQAGSFLAAVRATDSAGASTLQTFGITVNSASTLVVNAGADQSVMQGTAVAFSASYTTSGTVDVNTVEWDFDYDGIFNADANGTLTPAHTFNTPDTYVVAVRMTDSNQVTNLGILYVAVTNGAPDVDAGADATIPEGGSVTFAGTATDLGGAGQLVFVEWDFDYHGGLFTADRSGSLTPTHTFTDAGEYTVALRVTDVSLTSTIQTLNVTVTPVAPSVSAMQMGSATEGSPASFDVFISGDPDPNETFDVYVSWAPGAAFEFIGAAGLLGMGFAHTFADSTPVGGVTATVRVVDGDGAVAEDTFTVTVDNVAPTASLSASGGATLVGPGVPILFTDVSDVSPADAAAGFTYYHRLNNGDWVSSASASFLLPDYSNGLTYLIEGYVVDQDGGQSATSSTTVTTLPSGSGSGQTIVANVGDGTVILEDGKVIGPNEYYLYQGLDSYIGVSLQTGGATYDLYTNGQFDLVNALVGGADVGVFTNVAVAAFAAGLSPATGSAVWSATSSVAFYGSGNIGDIGLGGGGSLLAVGSRGDLKSVTGPGSGHVDAEALDLIFSNLTGSITGLDRIQLIQASGWIGDAIADEVWCNEGIGTLLAYGVMATVTADRNYNASGLPTTATIREGGIPGILDLGNALAVNVNGPINELSIQNQLGDIVKGGLGNVALLAIAQGAGEDVNLAGDINHAQLGDLTINDFTVTGNIEKFSVGGSLTIRDLTGWSIQEVAVNQNLKVRDLIATVGDIGPVGLRVGGNLEANRIMATGDIDGIVVSGNAVANGILANNVETVEVGGSLSASIVASGDVETVKVGGHFGLPPASVAPRYLVYALGTIGTIDVVGSNLGPLLTGQTMAGLVYAEGIGSITVKASQGAGGELHAGIRALSGGIGSVRVDGVIDGIIRTQGGDIGVVKAADLKTGTPPLGGAVSQGTIQASRKSQSDNAGGSIGNVELGTGSGLIHADNFITEVKLTDDAGSQSALTIECQAGAGGSFLKLATKATHFWVVKLTYGSAPTQFRVNRKDEDSLLSYGNNLQSFVRTLARKAGSNEAAVNLSNVEFTYDPRRVMVGQLANLQPSIRDNYTKPGTNVATTDWEVK